MFALDWIMYTDYSIQGKLESKVKNIKLRERKNFSYAAMKCLKGK